MIIKLFNYDVAHSIDLYLYSGITGWTTILTDV
jgi:hypothetical protein